MVSYPLDQGKSLEFKSAYIALRGDFRFPGRFSLNASAIASASSGKAPAWVRRLVNRSVSKVMLGSHLGFSMLTNHEA